jgi:hypothetical protein
MAATTARPILEVDDIVADLAAEQFHEATSEVLSARNAQGAKSFP